MFRTFQQLILTALFAAFASQASAMFIQADWYDPTKPGVGTNRYSYSFNDPVNLKDPSGNEISVEGTDEEIEEIEAAIEVVRNSGQKNGQMVNDLEKTKVVVIVKKAPNGAANLTTPDNLESFANQEPTGSTVTWNSAADEVLDEDGNPRSTPEAVLAHELQHAYDVAFGTTDLSDNEPNAEVDKLTPSHEKTAIAAENIVLRSQRRPKRDTYLDYDRTWSERIRSLWGDYEIRN